MKKIAKKILTVLLIPLSCIFIILIIELILWIFHYKPILRQAWYLITTDRVLDEEIIMIRPELLKDELYRRRENVPQIVAIGDSFTEGHPVPDAQSYPAVLKNFLNELNMNVDIINAGIGNTGPDQHLKLLKTHILPKTIPDILIWQFYANDIWDNVLYPVYSLSEDYRLIPESGKSHWIYIRQKIFNFIPLPVSLKKNSHLVAFFLKATEKSAVTQIPEEFRKNPIIWGQEKFQLEIEEMLRLSREHGFELFFFLIAPQAVYLAEEEGNASEWENNWGVMEYNHIHNILNNHINFIETKFNREDFQLITDNFTDTHFITSIAADLFTDETLDLNPLGDRHLNRYGYWLLARKIGLHILDYYNGKKHE